MSAPVEGIDYSHVTDVQLVGAFYGLGLCESGRDGGLPWAMTTPSSRIKLRLAFAEIAARWLPDGLLEEAADWCCDDAASPSLTLIQGGRDG